jgi:hypothetical protein
VRFRIGEQAGEVVGSRKDAACELDVFGRHAAQYLD